MQSKAKYPLAKLLGRNALFRIYVQFKRPNNYLPKTSLNKKNCVYSYPHVRFKVYPWGGGYIYISLFVYMNIHRQSDPLKIVKTSIPKNGNDVVNTKHFQ